MIPLKDAKLTKKLKAEVAKEWDVFNAIVEEHSTLSIPQFIKVCPEEYELVKYDKNQRTEYAVFVKGSWQYCIYFSPIFNRFILQTDVLYFNPKSQEWEATSNIGI